MDLLIVGNFRFPGGTSTSVSAEVRALAAAGYRIGLMGLSAGPLPDTRGLHPGIVALAAERLATLVPPGQPVSARLCCLHHPAVFQELPAMALEIDCARYLLIVHHPPVDAAGIAQYDTDLVRRVTDELFGAVDWAPVGPQVRAAFAGIARPPPLTPDNWHNVIDIADFAAERRRLPGARPVVGRHSRPQPVKWPDDRQAMLGAYPDAADVRIRLMGWGPELDHVVGTRPANWQVLPFGAVPVPDFLAALDYFSYFHSARWIEAFGRSILEAMASGLVCFLPPQFQPLFGAAAIYCAPTEVLAQVRRFESDPAAYRAQSCRAVDLVRRRFGPRQAVDRVRALIGPPVAVPARPAPPASVLYLTTNGIGMGHITRCLATARRLGPACRAVIVTMSKAFEIARSQGFEVEYLPFMRSIGIDHETWTAKVATELRLVLDYHRPDVLVFDGNVPYDGLIAALPRYPAMWKVWQRRPLWRPDVGDESLDQTRHFDVVLEPGEMAAPVDRGLTAARRSEAMIVPSVRFLDAEETLDRRAAQRLLGLDPARPALLMQLGAGNNFDIGAIVDAVCEVADPATARRPPQLVFARWRITENEVSLPPEVKVLDAFPIARFLNAFDCAVALAGYNTFHENLAAGLPTLFTSNDHPEQDEQGLRAEYGELRGLSLSARADDRPGFRRQLRRLLDPEVRLRLRTACRAIAQPNGAGPAAQFIEGLALTRKCSPLALRSGLVMDG